MSVSARQRARLVEFVADLPTTRVARAKTERLAVAFLAAVSVCTLLVLGSGTTYAIGMLLLAAAMIWGLAHEISRMKLASRNLLSATRTSPPNESDSDDAADRLTPAEAHAITQLDSRIGLTVLFRSRDEPIDARPIDVPIEPIRLSEREPAFRALRAAESDSADSELLQREASPVRRGLFGLGQYAFGAFGFSPMVLYGIRTLIVGPVGGWSYLEPAELMCFALILCIAIGYRSLCSYYLTPGGFVVRSSLPFATSSNVQIWRPESSYLLIQPHYSGTWTFSLRRRSESVGGHLTLSEVQMLLRFWLSALPPVEEGRIREMFAG